MEKFFFSTLAGLKRLKSDPEVMSILLQYQFISLISRAEIICGDLGLKKSVLEFASDVQDLSLELMFFVCDKYNTKAKKKRGRKKYAAIKRFEEDLGGIAAFLQKNVNDRQKKPPSGRKARERERLRSLFLPSWINEGRRRPVRV